ncbi:Hypothetical predicted protein [Mytilus galloprovincialis]|uniref:Uncharacterized protein n=1 Tax=Mytilus galloprovincialis TaxID=29158 RepID=A0A8B6BNE5_MYTGA|nr:Hypothetical predicted protein [Mytilus galloprovincialis]
MALLIFNQKPRWAPREPEEASLVQNVNSSSESVDSFVIDPVNSNKCSSDDSNDDGCARLKPGAKKMVKTKADGIKNRKQSLRMQKSRAIRTFKKLKDKLITQQVYEPVEVLYVIYEKKLKNSNMMDQAFY